MTARPRGFTTDWRPRAETRQLLDQAQAVIEEYRDQLPLTLRQIFYRLVGAHGYEKTELAYKRLTELLNKARRAGLVDMSAIRDDGFARDQPIFFDSVDHFLHSMASWADQLRLDRQKDQERRLVLWCEASGMVPQLARVAGPFGIEVCSSGGFDSLTDKHRIGQLWAGSVVTVLHIGDHDPSGVHVFSSLAEDIEAFAVDYGGDVEFIRLAVTPEQAALYSLPSAPPKPTDRRSRGMRPGNPRRWIRACLRPSSRRRLRSGSTARSTRRCSMRSRKHDKTCFRGCAMRDAATAANADDRPPSQSSRRVLTPLEAAIATGLPCFPCSEQKSPAIPGPGGLKHATDDPAALRALWRRHPGPLVGVRTGEKSGISVMDIDGPRHPEAEAWLAAHRAQLPLRRAHPDDLAD